MSSSHAASGAWLPAGRVALAAQNSIAWYRSWRNTKIEEDAKRLLAQWWRPFLNTIEKAREESRIHREPRYFWVEQERTAQRLYELAGALPADHQVYVTSSDFQTIRKAYDRHTPGPPASPAAAMQAA